MSYVCQNCKGVIDNPGSQPIRKVVRVRKKFKGTEIAKELVVCPPCSQILASEASDYLEQADTHDLHERTARHIFESGKRRNRK